MIMITFHYRHQSLILLKNNEMIYFIKRRAINFKGQAYSPAIKDPIT